MADVLLSMVAPETARTGVVAPGAAPAGSGAAPVAGTDPLQGGEPAASGAFLQALLREMAGTSTVAPEVSASSETADDGADTSIETLIAQVLTDGAPAAAEAPADPAAVAATAPTLPPSGILLPGDAAMAAVMQALPDETDPDTSVTVDAEPVVDGDVLLSTDGGATRVRTLPERAQASPLAAAIHAITGKGQGYAPPASDTSEAPAIAMPEHSSAWKDGAPEAIAARVQTIDVRAALGAKPDPNAFGQHLSAAMPVGANATVSAVSSPMPPTATVDVPMHQPAWGEAVGQRVVWMVNQQLQGAELKLTPPHLGSLEVRIAVHNDQASVTFVSPHAAVRDALEGAMPRLREMLGESGLNLVDVNVGDRAATGRQDGAGAGTALRGWQGGVDPSGSEALDPETGARPGTRVTNGLVDYFA